MKKIIFTIILTFLFTLCATAPIPDPKQKPIYIALDEPLYIYNLTDPFARVIFYYESRFREYAVNEISGARGIGQITKVMIDEVNKIISRYEKVLIAQGYYHVRLQRFTWSDAFDPLKSIQIWYIVQGYKNPEYYPDKAIRIWFGTGVQFDGKTWHTYYNDVMAIYEQFTAE